MKTLTLLFIGCLGMLLSGCSEKQECLPEVQVVYKTIEVPKVTSCKSPTVICDFSGDGYKPTKKLLECVVAQKRALEVCK